MKITRGQLTRIIKEEKRKLHEVHPAEMATVVSDAILYLFIEHGEVRAVDVFDYLRTLGHDDHAVGLGIDALDALRAPQAKTHPLDADGDGKLTISEMKITKKQLKQMILESMSSTPLDIVDGDTGEIYADWEKPEWNDEQFNGMEADFEIWLSRKKNKDFIRHPDSEELTREYGPGWYVRNKWQDLKADHAGHGDIDGDGIKDFADADPYGDGTADLDDPGMGVHKFEDETSADPFWDPDSEPGMIGRPRESDPLPRRSGERPVHGDEDPEEREYYEKWRASKGMQPGSSYRIPSHLRRAGKKLRRR